MNFDYGRTMAQPNMPFWGAAPSYPGAYNPYWNPFWGYGTFPTAGAGAFPGFTPGLGLLPLGQAGDAEIKDFVERSLDRDPEVPAHADIGVDVKNGVVTLTGTVPNKRIKHAVGDDAWWIPQVLDVHNELNVERRRPRTQETAGAAQPTTVSGRRGMATGR